MVKKAASIVLASLRPSTYLETHASGLCSLRPRWATFLTILLCGLLAGVNLYAAGKIDGELSVRDVLTMPGEATRVIASLTRRGSAVGRQGLPGEPLELIVESKAVGTAKTGEDGRAYLEYTPRTRGNHDITVRLMPGSAVAAPDAKATVGAWERRRPILLVELAAVIHQKDAAPVADAADELNRLAQFFYNVIYFSWSPGEGALPFGDGDDPREWLAKNKFPQGLTVGLRPGAKSLEARIEQLRADGWTNLKAGIGQTRGFAEVLAEHRIEVVIVPEPGTGELPKKAKAVKEWKEVRKKL
jgi:hypothetical protein